MLLFVYWTAWSAALCLMVYINASWLESRTPMTADSVTSASSAEVDQWRNVAGDSADVGVHRHNVAKTSAQSLTTSAAAVRPPSYTVARKQFHAVAVAVFLPGLLADVNVLRVAVSCSLVVLVMLEAGDD